MIVLQESMAADEMNKPVICTKCKRGKIGSTTKKCRAVISRRGRPPPDKAEDGLQIKCPVCGTHWTVKTE